MALEPGLAEVLEEWLYERSVGLHTALPGRFKSYDREKQTAEVVPVIKSSLLSADGSRAEVEFPVIPNVKVHWPRAGGYYIHFPIAADDYCQLIFNEASIALWRTTGKIASPGDLERHGLSHPYAIPGSWPDDEPMGDTPADAGVIIVDSKLRVSTEGGTAKPVANGDQADTELASLKSMLDTFAQAVSAWAGSFSPGGAGGAATGASAAGTMANAAGALVTALGSWPSESLQVETLEAE